MDIEAKELDQQEQQQQQDQQDAQTAFSAAFSSEPLKPAASAEPATGAVIVDEKTKEVEAAATPTPPVALTADEIASLRATAARLPELETSLRKANGRIGELNDKLTKVAPIKAAEAPAAAPSLTLKRVKEAYPDLAPMLTEDLAETIATLGGKSQDPEAVQALVTKALEDERASRASQDAKAREETVNDLHPGFLADIWVDAKPGGTRTEAYEGWMKSLPDAEAKAFENSSNPIYVARQLDRFKDWREAQATAAAAAAKAKDKGKERLEAAITPKGVPRAGQTTITDREAELKGFQSAFD